MTAPPMSHRVAAEFVGTFLLVFGGCGAAVLAANPAGDHTVGIGYTGIALAFGLALLAAVYAFGTASGGHFNPAVTLGAALAGRVDGAALLRYWVAQVLGGLLFDEGLQIDHDGDLVRRAERLARRCAAHGGDSDNAGGGRKWPHGWYFNRLYERSVGPQQRSGPPEHGSAQTGRQVGASRGPPFGWRKVEGNWKA